MASMKLTLAAYEREVNHLRRNLATLARAQNVADGLLVQAAAIEDTDPEGAAWLLSLHTGSEKFRAHVEASVDRAFKRVQQAELAVRELNPSFEATA